MQILGETIIGQRAFRGQAGDMGALAAATGEQLTPSFGASTLEDVNTACELAEESFDQYRQLSDEHRAQFLDAIAQGVDDLGDALIERVHLESGLPKPRLEGERTRTVNQLRLFASLLRDGRWHGAVVDTALPDRKPLPRADLRLRRIGVGPVAVFGASNFPLAFSVAGGDTASALAAGCPVIVKAHPAHLGTSELVGRVIQKAAVDTGMPDGVFSMLIDKDIAVGQALVSHPRIQAVGFTGSRRGGLALVAAAQARPVPIPVYAEMSSVNPVFLLPAALSTRAETIAKEFVDSLVLGTGQLCTNPGILLAIESTALERFVVAATTALSDKTPSTMLTPNIHGAYCNGLNNFLNATNVTMVAQGRETEGSYQGRPALFRTDSVTFLANPALEDENFGPSALLIVCKDAGDLLKVAAKFDGQLSATLHYEEGDKAIAQALMPTLERKAGRILFNGWPTGVEVSYSMVHGGPFPATSDSRSTSVGATAIDRFLRPICYQNVPDSLLPPALQHSNPLKTWRLVNGDLQEPVV
jgi:NADP-dependent aldehyde dehydrogenase